VRGIVVAKAAGMDAPRRTEQPAQHWRPGDRLVLRGEQWTVAGFASYPDCETLRVDADRDRRRRTFLLPFDRPQRIGNDRLVVVSARAWFRRFCQLLADSYPHGGLRSCPDSIDLLPYQLEPAIAMLRDGHPRLLIADAVGLGKTIEAGLILGELASRQEGFRAIVLLPAGLRQQWAEELAARFNLDTIAADASWLRDIGRALPPDVNPWSLPGIYLSSVDFVKRPEALHPLEDVRWDLVVVDEAHSATLGTDRRAAVDAIARRARRVLLLTATPPGDPEQFAALCSIGSLPGERDIPAFQRGRDVQKTTLRRSVVIPVNLTDEERHMHRVLERYTELVWRTRQPEARLVGTILRKRALSSASAVLRSLRRREELLSGTVVLPQHQLLLPLSDEHDAGEDDVSDEALAYWGLEDRGSEECCLRESIDAALAASRCESKARVLRSLLSRIREPAIVFTEYRDTLTWLEGLLTEGNIHTCVVHGGMTPGERRCALQGFGQGDRMLLATDAAAEGLNLHQHCRCVVHYELPWNPARVLQRVGRVDRIGQRRRVHEIALVAADTAEALVVAPFARRAAAWSDAIGRASLEWLTESRMAEAVFDGIQPESRDQPRAPLATSVDLRTDAAREATRLQARRTLGSRLPATGCGASAYLPATILKASRLASGAVLLFEIDVVRGRDVLDRSVVAFHCRLTMSSWPRRLADARRRITAILESVTAAALPMAMRAANDRADSIRDDVLRASALSAQRARTLQQAPASAARQLVQAGLFERSRPRATPGDSEPSLIHPADVPVESRDLTSTAQLRALIVIPPR
jgi:superfamily II DNA or RNA helicase